MVSKPNNKTNVTCASGDDSRAVDNLRADNARPLVIYHGGCCDGFCGAWIARRHMPQAEFLAARYGDAPPAAGDRDVLIVDFSYSRDAILQMRERSKSLLILDHHQTTIDRLGDLDCTVLDASKSGARLAWEHFEGDRPAHWLVDYTEDRDLWRWKLAYSREINAAIHSRTLDFQVWDSLARTRPSDLIDESVGLLLDHRCRLARYLPHAETRKLGGFVGRGVHCGELDLISDLGHQLAEGFDFGFTWRETNSGRAYSLRSNPDRGVNVAQLATPFGGGGHPQSAGFVVTSQ